MEKEEIAMVEATNIWSIVEEYKVPPEGSLHVLGEEGCGYHETKRLVLRGIHPCLHIKRSPKGLLFRY